MSTNSALACKCTVLSVSAMQQEVLASEPVAPVTTKLECAKLADGAACLVLVPGESQHANSSSRGGWVGGWVGTINMMCDLLDRGSCL
jgi:hypothetical protein